MPSFRALGEPGTRRVPAREPCDPESMSPSAQAAGWIRDSAVCRAGFLRNPRQTGFRNDNGNYGHMRLPYFLRDGTWTRTYHEHAARVKLPSEEIRMSENMPMYAGAVPASRALCQSRHSARSEEHTYELQSLMRLSYAVF